MFNKKFLFIYRVLLRLTIGNFLCSLFKRQNNRCVLGLRTNGKNSDAFFHNAKYMFLYLSKTKKMDCVWLCDNRFMREKIIQAGYSNVYARNSLKGIYYTLTSKYFLFDIHPHNITYYFSKGAILINFWHGTSWKKIGKDGVIHFQNKIYTSMSIKTNYFTVNNDYEKRVYKSAFDMKEENLIPLCSPRLDALFDDINNANLFMEKDFDYIKQLKKAGKNLLIYMPTYRDTGKDISGWLQSEEVKEFLKQNNTVLICKLHALDKNSLNKGSKDDCLYMMEGDSDVYPILKYTDGLITDYSSIALDYLLLDKPIIYYPMDLEEYLQKCRGFYVQYDEFVAGDKVYCETELINAMKKLINGVDDYKQRRKELKNKMFYYSDDKNCERMTNFLMELNK